jgi:hypothetical protein
VALLPLVKQALKLNLIEISDWNVERIYGGSFGVVYRFAGEGRAGDRQLPWTLILKVVRTTEGEPIDRSNPRNTRYWKREPLAYQSGFLPDSGGLVAPRCFGIVEQSKHEFWLWLEDVADGGAPWPTERYGLAARHFAEFSAGHVAQVDSRSRADWLGRGLLRAQARDSASSIERLPEVLERPLVRRFFPPDVAEGILRLWGEREAFFGAVDRLPQTVNHRDAFRGNLFGRRLSDGVEQTVAIDWEDVAVGPLGEEMVSMAVLPALTYAIEMDTVNKFEAHIYQCYLEGLEGNGWRGDPQLVRLGYALGHLRYALGLPVMLLALAVDEGRHADHEKKTGRSMSEIADHRAAALRSILARIDEARELMAVVH